jgi:hypothetical protein
MFASRHARVGRLFKFINHIWPFWLIFLEKTGRYLTIYGQALESPIGTLFQIDNHHPMHHIVPSGRHFRWVRVSNLPSRLEAVSVHRITSLQGKHIDSFASICQIDFRLVTNSLRGTSSGFTYINNIQINKANW